MELLPFVDILKVFNNPINEEQAWAVCYQCAHFLYRNQKQEFYQDVYDFGIHSIWLSRHGDVLLRKGPPDPNGSGKGPPHHPHNSHSHHNHHSPSSSSTTVLPKRKGHVIATETDAVQALGAAIFEALDYGIDASEERQLSHCLESLIVTMTNADNSLEYDPEAPNADDEGIEKDADVEHRCTVHDVIKLCSQHLSSKQDAQHHYKAVCRALATEAGELFTFLEKIATSKEKLSETQDEDAKRLEELQRADWACLWVQVMRSLRQGVRLKKVEHINFPPVEYELTPFEMLLEDIRSRRYTLHKIMVNGQIPHKVKNDAHAVILDFIRSRPPLKKVDDRKLKPKPPSPPDPHESLLKEIRSRPKLRPVKHGKLVVETSKSRLNSDEDIEPVAPAKRVIKPDFNLLLNNSFEESSEDEDHSRGPSLTSSPSGASSVNMTPPSSSWQRAVTRDALTHDPSNQRPTRLQRRHTIMVCESPLDGKVASQELPPLEEEEEPSPVRESHQFSQQPIQHSKGSSLLSRASSFSDHDLPSQVVLRNPQGHGRRSSLEHRRSLTSLTTGLCAIPEMEDSPGGGADSPTKAASAVRRSWSHEQAPPPNPSPPCKGRARAALGMGMAGMKSVGGPYHPGTHRTHASVSSSYASYNPPTSVFTSSGMVPASVNSHPSTSSSSSFSQRVLQSPSKHATTLSSASSVPISSSSSLMSSNQHASLDPAVSSQSPTYSRRSPRLPPGPTVQNGSSSGEAGFERRLGRWRHPNSREERLKNRRPPRISEDGAGSSEDVFDVDVSYSASDIALSEDDAQSRRLSLDSGVGMYTPGRSKSCENMGAEASRRLSVGLYRKEEGTGFAARRVKSPEEEERITRWRTLQEDDLAARTRRVGRDMTNQSPVLSTGSPEHQSQQSMGEIPQWRRAASQPALPVESTDVLQQKMADEEARFTRWRRLEEAGGRAHSTQEESSQPSAADREYVSDGLAARIQTATPSNSVASASAFPPPHGAIPLQKRWQNPVECLSLTLEEVTHIRSVLTKAELESLISHPELYQQVSKSKLCFTCKTTKFTLFGEWGTKCKFCKRTICSKCLRKMNVPTDHFRNIPVYTLSPTPLAPEMQDFIQNFIKNAPPCSVPPTRDGSPVRLRTLSASSEQLQEQDPQESPTPSSQEDDSKAFKSLFNRTKPLNRSQSLMVAGHKPGSGHSKTIKGPVMAICCDCKGMIMEIIRAARASLAMLSGSGPSLSNSLAPASSQYASPQSTVSAVSSKST